MTVLSRRASQAWQDARRRPEGRKPDVRCGGEDSLNLMRKPAFRPTPAWSATSAARGHSSQVPDPEVPPTKTYIQTTTKKNSPLLAAKLIQVRAHRSAFQECSCAARSALHLWSISQSALRESRKCSVSIRARPLARTRVTRRTVAKVSDLFGGPCRASQMTTDRKLRSLRGRRYSGLARASP
jgi:hypothetical protein